MSAAVGVTNEVADHFERWVLEKRARSSRGLSARSEAGYRTDVGTFAKRVADRLGRETPPIDPDIPNALNLSHMARISIADFTEDNLLRVMSDLVAEGYRNASRARMLSALRGFCGWLVKNHHLDRDPTLGFETPSKDKGLPVALTSDELQRVVSAVTGPSPKSRVLWPTRDLAMLAVLAGCGVRASELIGIRVGDFRWEDPPRLRVTGKGNKTRSLPLSPEVLNVVDEYLTEREGAEGPLRPDSVVFVRTKSHKKFTVTALDYVVELWLRGSGIAPPDQEKAHLFRHTYAVGVLDNGGTIAELQALLGHESIATTSIYLRMSAEGLHHTAASTPMHRLLASRSSA
ncbi:MAG: tyrosine-type recombinase/integrase [Acidimicrobiales bacterium]|nr:tyrosine-type recombinase/integrase [Acidimicrobiales bacterium]